VHVHGVHQDRRSVCCLTLEDCQQFDVDEVHECEGEQVCLGNQCVPTPDAPVIDGPGPDAQDPCLQGGGQIVFETDRDGDIEIARIGADGSGFELLTSNPWDDRYPAWSRDARFIAWTSHPTGTDDLNVMNVDGTDPHVVSPAGEPASSPAWSPAGDRLAFVVSSQIHAVDATGAGLEDLSQSPTAFDAEPAWSPNGSRIVFRRDTDIFTMDADGSAQAILTSPGSNPRWSPEGTYIAFSYATTGLMRIGTTPGSATTLFPGSIASFDWAPDGSNIVACKSTSISASDLYLVSPLGKGGVPITTTGKDCGARWSPDGTRIVFTSRRDGNPEIYVMNADGTMPVNLTMDPGADLNPAWAPCRYE
jgi:Tol biopolymer transport system component